MPRTFPLPAALACQAFAAWLLLSPSALPHGGVWRPPTDGVTNPGSAGAPTTGGRGPATVGARRTGANLDRWEAWWYFQREAYLPRHVAGRLEEQTSVPGYLTGRGGGAPPSDSPLLPSEARNRLLPFLITALRDESTEVVDAAAIALGRSVATNMAGPFLAPLQKTLAHAERTPRQAAVLGLGILGGPEAAALLREIVSDSSQGRQLCGASGSLDDLLRGLAALALGLTDQRENIEVLADLASMPGADREIAAASVLALGLHRSHAPFALAKLARLLEDGSLDRDVRAQVPIALQRLPGGRTLLATVLRLLAVKETSDEVSRSLVIALGAMAQPDEAEIIDALLHAAKEHSDSSTRHLALLSMGRIYERGGAPDETSAALRRRVQERLLAEVRDPDRRTHRAYAALALGIIGRGDRATAKDGKVAALTQLAGAKLIEEFEGARDPSLRGAFALALGLMGEPDAGPKLLSALDEAQNPLEAGHLALGCALAGEKSAIPLLRRRLGEAGLHPAVRIDFARALGLLEDRGFESELLAQMATADDLPKAAAYAKAIGLLGGRAAVEPLLELAQKQSLPEFRRAFAVVALGLLAEKSELPWNAGYLIDANFTTLLRPLQEVFDIL